MSGVLPIIFAQSIAMIIPTVAAFLPAPEKGTFGYALVNAVDSKSVLYMIVYFLMIIAFSYFYATIQFNPVEISNNLKKNGGFIPGFRPGKPTADFIKKVLNKVTLFGAIYLGVVAILPLLIGKIVNVSCPVHRRYLRHHRGGCCAGDGTGTGIPDADASVQGLPGIIEVLS